jgi:DNA gyrase subunit B
VRWWPDLALFSAGSAVDVAQLHDRLRQTAFLVPGLTLVVRDGRSGEELEEVFRFDGGTADFVEHLAVDGAVCDPVHVLGTGDYKETVPVLDAAGHMTTQTVVRHCEVDVALRWGTGYDTRVSSFCNVVATPHGGTHQAGFERALLRTVTDAMKAARVLRANDEAVIKDDVLEGLTAVVTVKVPEPQYLGQTKDELGTPGVSKIVADVVARGLRTEFLESKKRKAQARVVLEKVAAAAKTRQAAKASKDAARRKTALETSTLPAKLADCRSTDVGRTELWLVEGDSALGTGKLARNSEFQALLPLRGKILNVQKAGISEMLSNAECAAIIQVVGAGTGRTFDLDQMRYGKIVITTDADVDGAHIRCLLITLFARYMRPVIESVGCTPPSRRCTASRSRRQGARLHLQREADAGELRRSPPAGRRSRGRSSATRASARWTPTSWPRPPCTPPPHAAPHQPRRGRRRRARPRAAHGQRRRAAPRLHREQRLAREQGAAGHLMDC